MNRIFDEWLFVSYSYYLLHCRMATIALHCECKVQQTHWTAVCTRMCLGYLDLTVCALTPAQIQRSNKNEEIELRMLIVHCSPLTYLYISYGVWHSKFNVWRMNDSISMAENFNCTYYTLHTKFSKIRIFRISTCRTQSETNEIELKRWPECNNNVKKLKNSVLISMP